VVVPILVLAGCRARVIDDAALAEADADSANWLSYGRTYSEQRFSPLRQIDEQSVGRLGLAWWVDLGTRYGLEATSLVNDGVIYTTSAWSVVYAIDGRTGKVLWRFDPEGPRTTPSSSVAT
jgi:glucose dehydrogenase